MKEKITNRIKLFLILFPKNDDKRFNSKEPELSQVL